jgi:DNA repair ATPase RecN
LDIELLLNDIDKKIISEQTQITDKTNLIKDKIECNKKLNTNIDDNTEKRLLIQDMCSVARKTAKESFESLATNGVVFIFGLHVSVKIATDEKGGLPTADFKIKTNYDDYQTETDPTDEDGGGIADIVSLASFICMNILCSDNTAPIFVDEPTKFVSAGLASKVADFIKKVSHDYGKQIIMVTHAKDTLYSSDKAFFVEIDENGVSNITNIKGDDVS